LPKLSKPERLERNNISDAALFVKIKEGDIPAFDMLFTRHYKNLCFYSQRIIRKGEIAEEIVQELFIRVWENRGNIQIGSSVKSYLYRSVYNRSMNHIRDNKYLQNTTGMDSGITNQEGYYNADNDILYVELELKLFEIINSLPEKQKKVFLLKRLEHYTYKEIAQELGISEKMVEKYLSKAVGKLHDELTEYTSPLPPNLFLFFL